MVGRVVSHRIPGYASSLLGPLIDGAVTELLEVARTSGSVYYAGRPGLRPLLSVCTPSTVRFPRAFMTAQLPEPGRTTIGAGRLSTPLGDWQVTRWWRPPRPAGLRVPQELVIGPEAAARAAGVPCLPATYDGLVVGDLFGAGPGLTPAGDDVLAGALVAARATADPRLRGWQASVRCRLARGRTTPVSEAMLHAALDGYATTELAEYLEAVCGAGTGRGAADLDRATARLLEVGSSSGTALRTGVLHTLATSRHRNPSTTPTRGAA